MRGTHAKQARVPRGGGDLRGLVDMNAQEELFDHNKHRADLKVVATDGSKDDRVDRSVAFACHAGGMREWKEHADPRSCTFVLTPRQ